MAFPALNGNPHVEMNSFFELSNYRALGATMSADGFVVDRWYADFTGDGVTCAPGITGSGTEYLTTDGDYKSRATIDVNVNAALLDPGDDLLIRQRLPYSDRLERRTHHLRVWAFGPALGSFEIAINGTGIERKYARMYTRGAANLEMAEVGPIFIKDVTSSYMTLELFSKPADMTALYQIVAVQHEVLEDGQTEGGPLMYVSPDFEARRCAPFVYPCPRGERAITLAGGTQVILPMTTPVRMFATPSIVAVKSVVNWQPISSGVNVASSGTSTTGSVPHNRGGRIILGGFTALPAAPNNGVIDTDNAFLLEAEL